ncbi:hypothetical protein VC83_04761 [Pseudogymnoascus destructans]|uniref:Uncharacterized protein n=1 Tax=Pseudogymnoascus destructans TaxID=655981 RepID=A0A177A804_9PEZI|nr:uncharacterized protein VC83_04761 [Pseudogymnoascus destructans]OAF57562.1 hypothetical protein VC83_04761 [Pseudogymnoascus destructans]
MGLVVNLIALAFGIFFGVPASTLVWLELRAYWDPTGEVARDLRSCPPPSSSPSPPPPPPPPPPPVRRRNTHRTQRLIAVRLGILVRQGRRHAEADERKVKLLETLVAGQRTGPPRTLLGTAKVEFDIRDPGYYF